MFMDIFNLHSFKKRIISVVIIISILLSLLGGRLFFVQVINGGYLQQKATEQWTRDLPLSAKRGEITDKNGATLAVSYTTYNVYVRGREVKDAAKVASSLSEILNLDYNKTFEKVKNVNISEVLIKMQVEKEDAIKIYNQKLSGVYLAESVSRYYPYGDLLTQLIGFTTIDNQGQAGLEAYYDEILKGVEGYSLVQSDLQGKQIYNSLNSYVPSTPGYNIETTIDVNIQLAVERTLSKLLVEQKAKNASCIVMDPRNGEILAISSKPSFDLNEVPRSDPTSLMEMMKMKQIVDVYEPGSTFKILTMASVLDAGVAHLSDHFYCPGYNIVDGQKIKCWKSVGHGSEDLTDGLCNSCNTVFTTLALRMGLDRMYEYFEKFGLGQKSGIDFYGESSGIIMNKDNVQNVDLARMGFGQAIAVTPIQLISAISACVNGGILYEPYMVKKIYNDEGIILEENQPKAVRQVIAKEVSDIINDMLEETVSKAGKYTFIEGYEVAGKTGTTQKYADGKIAGTYISSFIGTYPASSPEYIVLIVVDEPGTGAYYGSVVASPYAKEILSEIFKLKNIEPDSPDYIPLERNIEMPNLVGQTLANACVELKKLGLNYEIQGGGAVITNQLPPAGTMLYIGQSVYLIAESG